MDKLSNQFERKVQAWKEEQGLNPDLDRNGFEIMSPTLYGWKHDESTCQWICYKAGRAIAAVTDETLSAGGIDALNTELVKMGAVPLPRGLGEH